MQGLGLRNVKLGDFVGLGVGNQRVLNAELLCPRCGVFSSALGTASPSGSDVAYVCRSCLRTTLVEMSGGPEGQTLDHYPKMTVTVDPSVPELLKEDYLEAQRCFMVAAWRACAVMSRRFVHSVMRDKGAEGRDLWEQIKDLEAKGILAPTLAEASQHIRVFGKYGAHPFEPSSTALAETTMADARSALDFCGMLIEYVYVLEARIRASRAIAEVGGGTPVAGP